METSLSATHPADPQNKSDPDSVKKLEITGAKEQPKRWKSLSGDAPRLELPTDRPRSAIQSFRGEYQQFSVSPELTEALEQLSSDEGVTLFMTLAAAFQVLLHRYSAQDDITIGTPGIGPGSIALDSLIGFFSKSLTLRSDLSGDPGFLELLAQVRDIVLGAYANQTMSIEQPGIKNPNSQPKINPPFQFVFMLQDISYNKPRLNGISPEFLQGDTETAKPDLALKLSKTRCDLTGRMEYNADLFEAATMDRLIGHFKALLGGIVALPGQRLSGFSLLTEQERQQLLTEWNNTAVSFPREKCIHELFEAQAAAVPDAVALVYERSQLSYAELNAQANRLAHQLIDVGVKPDTRVAICVERCLNMAVGMLAILKAGGAYLPLDPSYPKDRLAFMLEDSAPVALLTQNRLESLFGEAAKTLPVIDLDEAFPCWANRPDTNVDIRESTLTSRHLAYVIYTSGSTGKPKGVMVEHRNVVNFLNAMSQTPGINSSDVLLAVTTISFDIAGLELFLPLINGAKIVLISRANASDPVFLQETIAQSGITMLQATPATWRLLLNSGWQGSTGLKALCGGEALATDLSARLVESVGALWNLYGPTETTIWSTCQPIDASRGERYPFEAIGRPIDNTQIYILDAQLQLVPRGVSGEIYIGGAGVTRGYLNRPELTAERFVTDPFSTEAEARMYKTGDMARRLDDGSIEYLGRNDFQIKIRGYRIEIGEIETMLRRHPQLREVAVGVYEPSPEDKRLVAYWVPQSATVPSASELRDYLKPKLPEFMLPSAFVCLDALPLTPNGKLDRKALPEPDQSRQVADADFTAPRDAIEQLLTEIWCNALNINQIGIHDNFFELGGYSLLAVKAITEINERFNTDLPLGTIYQAPTIEELAIIVSSDDRQGSWYSLVPIQKQGTRPCLFAIHTMTLLGLSPYLRKDQPLYFLRYGMGAEVVNRSVRLPPLAELATHYIEELQQLQPQGPYYLIGFSFGGLIAYEMANQLRAKGQQVNLLGLLDTYLTDEKRLLPFSRIIHNFFTQSPGHFLELAKKKLNYWQVLRDDNTDFWPHIYTEGADIACLGNYRPETYKGQVTLFQGWVTESMFFSHVPPEQAWKKLLSDKLEVQPISGRHFEIFDEPHVKILAEKLRASMDKVIK